MRIIYSVLFLLFSLSAFAQIPFGRKQLKIERVGSMLKVTDTYSDVSEYLLAPISIDKDKGRATLTRSNLSRVYISHSDVLNTSKSEFNTMIEGYMDDLASIGVVDSLNATIHQVSSTSGLSSLDTMSKVAYVQDIGTIYTLVDGEWVSQVDSTYNVRIGGSNLGMLISGNRNFGTGYGNFSSLNYGSYNFGAGSQNYYDLTTGNYNYGSGNLNFYNLTSGNYNFGSGNQNYYDLTSGNNNFGAGYQNYYDLKSGSNNFGAGSRNFYNITSGSNNYGVGDQSGAGILSGDDNIMLGSDTGTDSADTLSRTVAIGYEAKVSQDGQIVIGRDNSEVTLSIPAYGEGNKEAQAEYLLGVDSDGDVVEAAETFILRSPDGSEWIISVDNSGNLTTTSNP